MREALCLHFVTMSALYLDLFVICTRLALHGKTRCSYELEEDMARTHLGQFTLDRVENTAHTECVRTCLHVPERVMYNYRGTACWCRQFLRLNKAPGCAQWIPHATTSGLVLLSVDCSVALRTDLVTTEACSAVKRPSNLSRVHDRCVCACACNDSSLRPPAPHVSHCRTPLRRKTSEMRPDPRLCHFPSPMCAQMQVSTIIPDIA